MDIDTKVIDAFFEQFKGYDHVIIDELFFTGGEPLLNVEAINYILDKISNSFSPTIKFNYFGIKTNGMVWNNNVEKTLYRLFEFSNVKDSCWISCSLDQFHIKPNETNIKKFESLPFFDGVKKITLKKFEILNTGLAYKNGLGCPKSINNLKKSKPKIRYIVFQNLKNAYPTNEIIFLDDILINCKGFILNDVDGSFVFQDTFNRGNILIDDLMSISKQVELKKIKVKQKVK